MADQVAVCRAGAKRVWITPDLPCEMAGYFHSRIATTVARGLYAAALALEIGGQREGFEEDADLHRLQAGIRLDHESPGGEPPEASAAIGHTVGQPLDQPEAMAGFGEEHRPAIAGDIADIKRARDALAVRDSEAELINTRCRIGEPWRNGTLLAYNTISPPLRLSLLRAHE